VFKNKITNSLNALVFLEGFTVLALQILVAVIATPYWGNSFVFWSLSLFFVMLALSLGYFLAPFVLKKTKKHATGLLVKLLWFLFLYLIFIFINSERLLIYFISNYSSLIWGNAATLFVFIFIPVLCMAMIPILAIGFKDKTESESEGEKSGKVFSLSSVSGIVAVILLTFVTIPVWGILVTKIILVSVVFLLFFIFLLAAGKKLSSYILIAVMVLGVAMLSRPVKIGLDSSSVQEIERVDGMLGQIRVVDYLNEKTRYFFVNNAAQSKIHATGRSLFPYVYSTSIYSSCKPVGSDVLLAGMGGGSLVYELSNFGHNVDIVDIDPRLEGIVQKHGLVPTKKANFIESDIRRYVNNSDKKYDVIILDLSKGEIVPTNVYTLESFINCKGMLKEDGLLMIHFLSSLTENGQLALASVGKTLREAGFDYRLMNRFNKKSLMDGVEDLSKPSGYIFCAAEQIDFSEAEFIVDASIIDEIVPKKGNLFLEFNDAKGLLLTDDKPILDVLQMENAAAMRKINIKTIISTERYGK
jgi:predicted membrane-bound spermidine synthase